MGNRLPPPNLTDGARGHFFCPKNVQLWPNWNSCPQTTQAAHHSCPPYRVAFLFSREKTNEPAHTPTEPSRTLMGKLVNYFSSFWPERVSSCFVPSVSFPENSRALPHDALLEWQVGSHSLSSGSTLVRDGLRPKRVLAQSRGAG